MTALSGLGDETKVNLMVRYRELIKLGNSLSLACPWVQRSKMSSLYLAVFCNHPESASIRLVCCVRQVGYMVSGCSLQTICYAISANPAHPSTQNSVNAVFLLSTKTHPLLHNEELKTK